MNPPILTPETETKGMDAVSQLSTQVAVLATQLNMFMNSQETRLQELERWRSSGSQRFTGIIATVVAGAAFLVNFIGVR